uniref:cyclin-dependent kinase n=1 Tax=Strigamia maritima TaxID=126957 RepID=T1IJC7_STRMM
MSDSDFSEDGELQEDEFVPRRGPRTPPDPPDGDSPSSREEGTEDSLDIKPPQATTYKEKSQRRDRGDRKDKHSHKAEEFIIKLLTNMYVLAARRSGKERHRGYDYGAGVSRQPNDGRPNVRERRHREEVSRRGGRGDGRMETRDARERIREREREKEREDRERERQEWMDRERRRDRFLMAERDRERRERQRREVEPGRRREPEMESRIRKRSRSPRDKKSKDAHREKIVEAENPGKQMRRSPRMIALKLSRQGMSMVVEDVDDDDDEQEEDGMQMVASEKEEEEEEGQSSEGRESVEEESEHSAASNVSSNSSASEEEEEEIKSEKSKSDSASEKTSEDGEHSEHEKSLEEIVLDLENEPQTDVDKNNSQPLPEEKPELPPFLPAIHGCRSVEEFNCLNRIEEGTYGVVYRARDRRTDEIVALKRLKMEKEKEGFPITSLREVNTLLKAQHPNIVTVREIVVGSNMDKIYIVMDYVEHDLKSLMETMKQPFIIGEVKTLMSQLLRAVAHLHDNWILHRDLKTSNLLLSHKGILKVGDFGLAREYGSPLKQYTPIVVTLWYRAPELLLGVKEYSTPIDLWSVGCIFGELLTMKPLFPGTSERDQLNRVYKDLGTPNDTIWPGFSDLPLVKKMSFAHIPYHTLRGRFAQSLTNLGFDLMNRFLTYNPASRITAEKALQHGYFTESPLPVAPHMFPTWPAKSELGHNRTIHSPKPPSGGKQYKQLGDADEAEFASAGFHMNIPYEGQASKGAGFNRYCVTQFVLHKKILTCPRLFLPKVSVVFTETFNETKPPPPLLP